MAQQTSILDRRFEPRWSFADRPDAALVDGMKQELNIPTVMAKILINRGITDVQGARYIKSVCPAAMTFFVLPPSWDELEWRLRSRATDSAEQLELRLRTARDEIAAADEFDHTVVNDDLNACVDEIERILAAERSRKDREAVRL